MLRRSLSFISNRFISVLLLGTLVLLGISEYHQWENRQKITRQIESLKAEAATVEDKNSQLEDSLKYLSSTSATERLARQQNLKKEGEIAVVFMPAKDIEGKVAAANTESNVRAWWEYFFSKN
jgi:cell division protein FtsB